MVANKYAFLQITRRRFLNEWEAFKKVISRRNIRRRITIPLTLSNLKLLRRITRTENILHRNFTRRQVAIQNRVARDRKSGSAGMPRPISYAVFCLKKKKPPRREGWALLSKHMVRSTLPACCYRRSSGYGGRRHGRMPLPRPRAGAARRRLHRPESLAGAARATGRPRAGVTGARRPIFGATARPGSSRQPSSTFVAHGARDDPDVHSFPTRRSSDLRQVAIQNRVA